LAKIEFSAPGQMLQQNKPEISVFLCPQGDALALYATQINFSLAFEFINVPASAKHFPKHENPFRL